MDQPDPPSTIMGFNVQTFKPSDRVSWSDEDNKIFEDYATKYPANKDRRLHFPELFSSLGFDIYDDMKTQKGESITQLITKKVLSKAMRVFIPSPLPLPMSVHLHYEDSPMKKHVKTQSKKTKNDIALITSTIQRLEDTVSKNEEVKARKAAYKEFKLAQLAEAQAQAQEEQNDSLFVPQSVQVDIPDSAIFNPTAFLHEAAMSGALNLEHPIASQRFLMAFLKSQAQGQGQVQAQNQLQIQHMQQQQQQQQQLPRHRGLAGSIYADPDPKNDAVLVRERNSNTNSANPRTSAHQAGTINASTAPNQQRLPSGRNRNIAQETAQEAAQEQAEAEPSRPRTRARARATRPGTGIKTADAVLTTGISTGNADAKEKKEKKKRSSDGFENKNENNGNKNENKSGVAKPAPAPATAAGKTKSKTKPAAQRNPEIVISAPAPAPAVHAHAHAHVRARKEKSMNPAAATPVVGASARSTRTPTPTPTHAPALSACAARLARTGRSSSRAGRSEKKGKSVVFATIGQGGGDAIDMAELLALRERIRVLSGTYEGVEGGDGDVDSEEEDEEQEQDEDEDEDEGEGDYVDVEGEEGDAESGFADANSGDSMCTDSDDGENEDKGMVLSSGLGGNGGGYSNEHEQEGSEEHSVEDSEGEDGDWEEM